MAYKHTTGGDTSDGGKFLSDDGTYHLLITGMEEVPTKKDGAPIDNAAFRAELSVLSGTVDGQKDKVTDILFFGPKPSDKNDGAFAKKKIDRFFLAAGLATREQLDEKDNQLEIELNDACGRQIVAKFTSEEGKNGKPMLGLSFCDIWHIDDPKVKSIPKDAESLAMLPASDRWVGEQKAEKKKPADKTAEKKQPAAADDYSDL